MRITETPDRQLVSLYIQGKEQALEVLVSRHKNAIYGHIYNLVRNAELADDLFQETFIKAIRTLKKGAYNEEGKFLPWIMRIAHNLTIDYFRKNSKNQFYSSTDDYDVFNNASIAEAPVELNLSSVDVKDKLQLLIDHLPEEQKEVLKMRIFCDMSFKEIAEETNVSINTALGRMRYALINIRKLMDEKQIQLSI